MIRILHDLRRLFSCRKSALPAFSHTEEERVFRKDIKMAANGQIPKAFLLDPEHFNQTANEAIGKRISKKLLELKYVNKIQ